MPDIYKYLDYRAFLNDYYHEQKARLGHFSHQYFARKAGIGSSGYVLHVIKRERNLSRPLLLKIARAIGLNAKQTEYFENLVCFDQAKTQSDKDCYFSRIAENRKSISIKTLDERQYDFYSTWYNSAIRELITMTKRPTDPKQLAKMLVPRVSASQVKKALRLMEELGIIKKNREGEYIQNEAFVFGGGPVRNLAIVKFQKEMLKHNLEIWDRFKAKEISASTLTLCMSEDLLEEIRKEIQQFRKKLFEMVAAEKKAPERVYQMNIGLFPLTVPVKGI